MTYIEIDLPGDSSPKELILQRTDYNVSFAHFDALQSAISREDRALARPDSNRTFDRRDCLAAVRDAVFDAFATRDHFRPELHDLTEKHAAAVFKVMELELRAIRNSALSGGKRPTETYLLLWEVYHFVRDNIERVMESGR